MKKKLNVGDFIENMISMVAALLIVVIISFLVGRIIGITLETKEEEMARLAQEKKICIDAGWNYRMFYDYGAGIDRLKVRCTDVYHR